MGSGGLRAGWGAALFLIVYLSLDAIVGRLLDQLAALRVVNPVPLSTALIRESIELAVVLGSTWAMSKVMRRWFRSYGYAGHKAGRRLGAGAAWGFTSLSALILCMWLTRQSTGRRDHSGARKGIPLQTSTIRS